MLNTLKNILPFSAIALGLTAFNTISSAQAQTNTVDSFQFDKIELEEDNWNFQSENETVSIQDNLQDLRQYSIDDLVDTDVRLVEKKWGNRGDVDDYSIKTNIYNY